MEADQSKILLVEGSVDKGVITEVLKAWDVPCPYIRDCGSVDEVFKMLKLYLTNPGQYKIIGIIVDADTNPEGRSQRFAQTINASGRYSLAERSPLREEGLILNGLDNGEDRVGLWVMPDNQGHGMLEDFLAELAIAVNPELMDESEHAIAHVEELGIQQYTAVHRPKAKMHTYLAWQKEPGTTLPTAIMKHYLDATSDNARLFVEWINHLFWHCQHGV